MNLTKRHLELIRQRLDSVGGVDATKNIPQHIVEDVRNYVLCGVPCGDFLQAVIEGRLYEVVARGSRDALVVLPNMVRWIFLYTPIACCGSPANYTAWLRAHQELRETESQPVVAGY